MTGQHHQGEERECNADRGGLAADRAREQRKLDREAEQRQRERRADPVHLRTTFQNATSPLCQSNWKRSGRDAMAP